MTAAPDPRTPDAARGEERAWRPVWGERPRTVVDGGLVGDDSPASTIVGWEKIRRSVGPWEVVPLTDEERESVDALMATKEDRDDRIEGAR